MFKSLYSLPALVIFTSPLICAGLFAQVATAGVVTTQSKVSTFNNSNCEKTQSCDLVSAELRQEDYRVDFNISGQNRTGYGTRMFLNYRTKDVSQLEEFGAVQFIHGCQYMSHVENGRVVREQTVDLERDSGHIPFVFPDWNIDGFVDDPIEWGSVKSAGTRHGYYFNQFPGSAAPTKSEFFEFQKPTAPSLWLRDLPGAAQYFPKDGSAHNISLEFKTCIYKTAGVPRSVPYLDTNFATPIQCFTWSSSYVYNHDLHKFESPKTIDPYCSQMDAASDGVATPEGTHEP